MHKYFFDIAREHCRQYDYHGRMLAGPEQANGRGGRSTCAMPAAVSYARCPCAIPTWLQLSAIDLGYG